MILIVVMVQVVDPEGGFHQAMQESEEMTTWRGIVVSIHVTGAAGEPMCTMGEVRAVAGRGLEGAGTTRGRTSTPTTAGRSVR
ncbi:MAG: hypothetical protein AVDCRST_MAG28-2476 [uncultured Rubrobacteraceae bacterium]|uniref:Uncharacterized protein n=1 Tax=uncultured Rubrobacteraceae bacterium TaxID=349277 RepID=A0A6J4R231_9ACTN|nr:MAG: hypothetical protein AVDCRST_MAG28-2476 [uncultured Rubrobacteraceae bacterium]